MCNKRFDHKILMHTKNRSAIKMKGQKNVWRKHTNKTCNITFANKIWT
jgi:hypothetical protein